MMDGPSASPVTAVKRTKAAPKTKAGGKKADNPKTVETTKDTPPLSEDDLQGPYNYFGNMFEHDKVHTKLEWDDESI